MADQKMDTVELAEQVAAMGASVDNVSKVGRAFLAGAETALRAAVDQK